MSIPMTPGSSGVFYRPNRAPVIDEDGPTDAAVADTITEEAEAVVEVVEEPESDEADGDEGESDEASEEPKRRPGRPKKVVESSEPE
jgi:hypothetical protein